MNRDTRSVLRTSVPLAASLVVLVPAGLCAQLHDPSDFEARAYRHALALHADGQPDAATRSLVELEARVLDEEDPPAQIESLRRRELEILGQLAGIDPEALVPVAELHRRVYEAHLERRASLLSGHTARVIRQLVDRYVADSSYEHAPKVGSRLLTRLAEPLYGSRGTADSLLSKAVELDPRNEAALLGLGASYERIAKYEQAVEVLGQIHSGRPESAEGRLRLAINLRRLDSPSAAAQLLEALLVEDTPEWIRSLAYQELAQIGIEARNWEGVRQLLERGVELLPREQKLRIQLAYVYERCQRQRDAQRAVERLQGGPTLSARDRYNQFPHSIRELTRQLVDRLVESRLAALQKALRALEAPSGEGA